MDTGLPKYTESYGIFACSGILFNHESPLRGETFVTKKIVRSAVKYLNNKEVLEIGNLNAVRDWGHAKDYVKNMWLMLQKSKPQDYVISTGKSYTVRQFIQKAYNILGIKIVWKGKKIKK